VAIWNTDSQRLRLARLNPNRYRGTHSNGARRLQLAARRLVCDSPHEQDDQHANRDVIGNFHGIASLRLPCVTHPDDVATATSARLNEGQSTAGLSVSVAHGKMKRVARGCSFERRKAENRTSDGSARLTAASECWAISLGSDLERIIVSVLGYMRGSSSCSTDA
jgi:hypothetical protein